MNEKIYLSSPHMGGSEQDYVQEAFASNWIAPLGPNVSGFELAIESYLGEESHVAALSSGTAAIHLALILLGVGRGDEVICQSLTFSASANPIVYLGATPVFVDSESETWNISPHYLEEAIKSRTAKGKKPKAIVAVHLYGMPYKAEEIREIADKYGIPIVEDSAEALGSTYKERKCGTFGDISILSFNGNKIITTSGGGALVSRNPQHKSKAVFLATQARDEAPHYQHSHIGYNYRLSNVCAGIGRGQMEILDDHVALRRKMNQFYKGIFNPIDGIDVFSEPNPEFFSNHWLSCIIFNNPDNNINPDGLREALLSENIESRPIWKPMHLQPVFKDAPYYGDGTSESIFKNGLCLPSGSNLTEIERERIEKSILAYFNS
ncbi:aminotransferase class I/II-fold pyridoxal phosphate-dependent enzyme [Aequorivita sp. H23M31]|uniref:GDP-perosamine synthase n=1 Tax=Aequorivita ciconiae TaxID=2494375 RepID=A0A410G252_9FLAO|nr:aminotransferase class I/II-fold pyridoxal phosphate-dependent enzyme [Aequorivita sp. H23M31]QAA81342.1 aminotransferase class I/II-fold pyridoxal phosphate-dependent enzyme [Aequorivita sp. H23M31]